MIGLDTNVVVRYITQDDARQAAIANRLFEKTLSPDDPGFVSIVTLCEIAWVLADCYGVDDDRIRAVMEGLLGSKQLQVESSELVWKALRAWQGSGADFADVMIGEVCIGQGASHVATFDKRASRLASFKLLA